jgi:hypothetical protein
LCVRWYLRFKLSLRDLVEMMAERRKSEGRLENRLSKNRTEVVTTNGASQFSVSGRNPVS